MIKSLVETLDAVVPFLSPYPPWVKLLLSVWVLLTATLLLALVLSRSSEATNTSASAAAAPSPTNSVWLKFEKVQLYGELEGGEVKLQARLNGNVYRYPAFPGIDWLEVGPQMAPQSFRVPAAPQYDLSFSGAARLRETSIDLVSVNSIHIGSLPASGTYSLYKKNDRSRAANVIAEVSYLVTNRHPDQP